MVSTNNSGAMCTTYEGNTFAPSECLRALQTPIRFIKGVGPMRAALLERMGLKNVEDLLYHLPFRYDDRRKILRINEVAIGQRGTFIGRLDSLNSRRLHQRNGQILMGSFSDGTGELSLLWFHPKPFITKSLRVGKNYVLHGRVVSGKGYEKEIVHPEFELLEINAGDKREEVLPIYVKPGGISIKTIRRWIKETLIEYRQFLPSYLPDSTTCRNQLIDLGQSLSEIHQPDRRSDVSYLNQYSSLAHHSIVFDEFFYLQLALALQKKHRVAQKGITFHSYNYTLSRRMRSLLPYVLTGAQERVLGEIITDMESSRPMQRLIQGDVGSGKTIIAWFAALKAIENQYQAVLMVPTELLAEQHFHLLKSFSEKLGISIALLTGSIRMGERRILKNKLMTGEISLVVGTHALIQGDIFIPHMGLAIIDEQHRFGVTQRMNLRRLIGRKRSTDLSNPQPDILLMTATPIPRSLAMVLYGDLEVSLLDELPPGRMPVCTKLYSERDRFVVYRLILEAVHKGQQAYVVYPLVEESERLHLRDATRMAKELSLGILQGCRIGLIHGRMDVKEREVVMGRFKRGEIEILVSTTVIEVGIDVPNATTIVVEHAERFGLSQLHQLRGRVGRGMNPSQCLLVHYNTDLEEAQVRLKLFEKIQDGFKIAEEDLKLRGPGEFLGIRQSGLPDFRLASLVRDSELLFRARREALDWLSKDPKLVKKESKAMREILTHRWGKNLELGIIG